MICRSGCLNSEVGIHCLFLTHMNISSGGHASLRKQQMQNQQLWYFPYDSMYHIKLSYCTEVWICLISSETITKPSENVGRSKYKYVNLAHVLSFTKPETICGGCFYIFILHVWKAGANRHRLLHTDGCCLSWGLWDCKNSSVWFKIISCELLSNVCLFFFIFFMSPILHQFVRPLSPPAKHAIS